LAATETVPPEAPLLSPEPEEDEELLLDEELAPPSELKLGNVADVPSTTST
jgi:hypothetical protein